MDDRDEGRTRRRRRLTLLGVALAIVVFLVAVGWRVYGGWGALAAVILVIGLLGAAGREDARSKSRRGRPAETPYPPNWDELRRQVYQRDKHRCANCRRADGPLHAHHIVPLRRGGTNTLTNIVTVCAACHALIHPHMRSPRD